MFSICDIIILNFEEIKKYPQRFSNIQAFINNHNWEGINYPSKSENWKILKKSNPKIAINYLCSACISKINSNCEKQTVFLMYPNEEK